MRFHPKFKDKVIETHWDRKEMIEEIRKKDKDYIESNFENATDRQIISILKELNDPWVWQITFRDEEEDKRTQHELFLDNEA